jgi:protease-4
MPDNAVRRRGGCLIASLLFISFLVNLVLCGVIFWPDTETDEPEVIETHLWGSKTEANKIAVVRVEGPLVEGLDGHILRQIDHAGGDGDVKGVVVRIDSPGGSIGSSEAIHRELTRLRHGQHPRHPGRQGKPLVASMASVAASGGYYIAMPADKVLAEKGTLTGSIGVFAALPNVSELAKDNGVRLELIKAGGIKGSGSPLHQLSPEERQPWQDMVDQAYDQFLDVVAKGRPKLTKEQLRTEVVMRKMAKHYDDKGNVVREGPGQPKEVEVTRVRADGGTYTAAEAKQFGLIDDIGLLEDAVAAAATAAGLSSYKVVTYKREPTLWSVLFGARAQSTRTPELGRLSTGLAPRIWYLAPGHELSGIVAASSGGN